MTKLDYGFLGVLLLGAVACGGSTDAGGTGGAAGGGAGGAVGGSGGAVGGTGGTSVGGSGGVGGSTGGVGGGGTGGTNPFAECTDDSQCTLFSDCCTCVALGPNEGVPPSCDMACKQNTCEARGVTSGKAQCVAGQCIVGYECRSEQALCNMPPPKCDPGQMPSIINACYGPCVPATECASVSQCTDCNGPLTTCVHYDMQSGDASANHCVQVPKGCEGSPTCACMGANVCTAPFSACTDFSGVPGMSCSCPNC
ncbi:MAG: hypothetical protein U0263_12215 [Polyangiaceae bacterium]